MAFGQKKTRREEDEEEPAKPQHLEPEVNRRVQVVGQAGLDRAKHVWYKIADGRWKCVICGGVSKVPSSDDRPDRIEELTDTERAMCPPPPVFDGIKGKYR